MDRYVRSFANPDQVIEVDRVRSELITKGGMTVSHDIQQPGWRWSVDIRPLVGTEWCEVRHIGVVLRGRIGYLLQDGTEFEAGPLELMDIPPRHDAWVIGDEALETIAWTGAKGWLAPLESMSERVLATVLFTDVVESTATAQRLGYGAWADLLDALETRTRDLLSQFRGPEVGPGRSWSRRWWPHWRASRACASSHAASISCVASTAATPSSRSRDRSVPRRSSGSMAGTGLVDGRRGWFVTSAPCASRVGLGTLRSRAGRLDRAEHLADPARA